MLTLLVGGDLDALVSVRGRLQHGFHVVVAYGTGAMANILGKALSMDMKQVKMRTESSKL